MRGHIGDLSKFKAHRITEDLGEAQSRNVSSLPNQKGKNSKGGAVKLWTLYLFHGSADAGQQHIWPNLENPLSGHTAGSLTTRCQEPCGQWAQLLSP